MFLKNLFVRPDNKKAGRRVELGRDLNKIKLKLSEIKTKKETNIFFRKIRG